MKILIVDDRDDNRYLLESLLRGNGHEVQSAANGAEAFEQLQSDTTFDLIISDILMPVMDGFQLCRKVKSDAKYRYIPFIIYTATYTGPKDEEFALKIGADRFITKPCEPDVFISTVYEVMEAAGKNDPPGVDAAPREEDILRLYNERLVRKLEQKMLQVEGELSTRHALEKSLQEVYQIISNSPAIAFLWENIEGWPVRFVSGNVEEVFGYTAEEFTSGTVSYGDIVYPGDRERVTEEVVRHTRKDITGFVHEPYRIITRSGDIKWVDDRTSIRRDENGNIIHYQGIVLDITERKLAQEALLASEEQFRTLAENIGIGVAMISPDMEILTLNRQMSEWFPNIETSAKPLCYKAFNDPPGENPCSYCPTLKTLKDGQRHEAIAETPTPNGIRYYRVVSSSVMNEDGSVRAAIEMVEDVTEQKHAEKEKKHLEEQLQQSQKMESIGRLAGGVAHDFNNLLTAILGYSDMIQSSLDHNDPIYKDVEEIVKAAQSATALTRQLLAFSRKQVISTKVVDVNKLVEHSTRMLSRLIGEDIDLVFSGGPNLWKTKADPAQIDQILVNLVVNSRDAMRSGGKLTIETSNIVLDDEYCRNHLGTLPGEFVMLAVSDNGDGMDTETQARIFEPFFTTKPHDKGTGLGLSMVYGIVQQHGGFVFVYSEPGEGTTFKVYLRRFVGKEVEIEEKAAAATVSGSETILLVEDQGMVRRLAKRILEQSGFRVLDASDGGDAYLKCETFDGEIDLLLTDVVMPNMNGKELYKRIVNMKPGIRVLFMSGYTDEAITHHGVLDPGTMFLHKPFKVAELLQKVRETLDAPPGVPHES